MKVLKPILSIVLLACIVGLVYVIYNSVNEPVRFNKQKEAREAVAVKNLKDIRTLQVAFKGENNRFCSTIDSLVNFYETGEMSVMMKIGSADDSVAYLHTEALKKSFKGLNKDQINDKLYDLYLAGDKNVIVNKETKVAVKEALKEQILNDDLSQLKYIPFSGNTPVEMTAVIKTVSGVQVPLFEAKMPYKLLLKGMDNQLRINLDAQRQDQNKYTGLQVGSIEAPNNNAGNWE